MSEMARSELEHPSAWMGAPAWQTLVLLARYRHDGRPDGEPQGGALRSELKAAIGIDGEGLRMLTFRGLIQQSAASFTTTDADDAWLVMITPDGEGLLDRGHMHQFLWSIATAEPQSEQAKWMVATARQGLRWKT